MHDELIVEEGVITRLTINRPERHNAINTEVGDAMIDVVTKVGRDPAVQVLVLAGKGRSFCSGDDVKEGADGGIPDYPWPNPYHAPHIAAFNLERHPYFVLQPLLRRIPQIVIAQVQGYCMGSGFDLMLAADYAIADPDAQLRMVIGATAFLPKYVGLKHATRLILDDRFTSAQEAAELGLITKVAAPGALADEVTELAERLAEMGQQRHGYFGVLKESLNRSLWPGARRRPAHAADRPPHVRPLPPAPVRAQRPLMDTSALPLSGAIIIDLSDECLSLTGRFLADLGAEVIRVEAAAGDALRIAGPHLADRLDPESGLRHLLHNAGKRSVALNFDAPAAWDLVDRLLARADIVIAPLQKSAEARRVLATERLRRVHPHLGLIDAVMKRGGEALPASDLVGVAAGGIMQGLGYPDAAPDYPAGRLAYKQASLVGAATATAMLHAARHGAPASHVCVSLQEAILSTTIHFANQNMWRLLGEKPKRRGGEISTLLQAQDGRWLTFGITPNTPARFQAFAQWLHERAGYDGLIGAEFPGDVWAPAYGSDTHLALVRACASLPRDELCAEGQARGFLAVPVNTVADIVERPPPARTRLLRLGRARAARPQPRAAAPADPLDSVRTGRTPRAHRWARTPPPCSRSWPGSTRRSSRGSAQAGSSRALTLRQPHPDDVKHRRPPRARAATGRRGARSCRSPACACSISAGRLPDRSQRS